MTQNTDPNALDFDPCHSRQTEVMGKILTDLAPSVKAAMDTVLDAPDQAEKWSEHFAKTGTRPGPANDFGGHVEGEINTVDNVIIVDERNKGAQRG